MNEKQKNDTLPAPIPGAESEVQTIHHSSLWSILLKLWKYGLSVFILFFVTLSCYPSVNSAVVSVSSAGPWKGKQTKRRMWKKLVGHVSNIELCF